MERNNSLLRDMLCELSTEQLDARLAAELHKEDIDDDAVRLMLEILREREKDIVVTITPELRVAWEKLQQESSSTGNRRTRNVQGWLVRAASIGIVFLLLFTMLPQQAQADNFWDRLVRWTDDVFEFFDPHSKEAVQDPYVFRTDNPGLQQVYDKVVEMGITDPVVPMWLPEGYELVELKDNLSSSRNNKFFCFSDENSIITFYVSEIENKLPGQFQKDKTQVEKFENQGTTYYIMHNIDMITATWTKDNIECCLSMDSREDVVYKILKSIYSMEDIA